MTRSKVRADHMIKNPRRIRAIRPSLKMEMVKAASLVIMFLVSITECANCPPCPFRHGVYKCTKPKFATCVTLHGQPDLREITVFDCRVTIKKIEWKNNHGVIIRDRFQQICTETTEKTKQIETTSTTPVTTRPEKHETTERTKQIETTTTTTVTTRPEKHETTVRTKQTETTTTLPRTTRSKNHGTTIKDLKEKFLKAMNSAEETESLTDMALGFLMWAIMASVAAFLVLLKKWFLKKCCGEERSTNNQPTQQPTLNPAFSPGQLSVIPLMVMHTPPSSTISGSPSSTSVTITPEINREEEEEEEEEPIGHRTRLSCARRLNWSKTSVV